ncbi:MAG: DUF2059 domain-containing protein [Burkholderiaceae bacterium]|nr:DUF2059 domain-containing protein [Burkholderiaceae bacterium]
MKKMANLRFIFLGAIYCSLFFSVFAAATSSTEAKKLVQLVDFDRSTMLNFTNIIYSTRPKLGDQKYISFVTCVDTSDMKNLREVLVSILDKKLSLQELAKINGFYQSDVGKKKIRNYRIFLLGQMKYPTEMKEESFSPEDLKILDDFKKSGAEKKLAGDYLFSDLNDVLRIEEETRVIVAKCSKLPAQVP